MKKGFTLVELLGAIILLGLISLLIAVPIISRINNASNKISKATERIIKEHVMQYISENSNDFRSTKPGTKYYITLDELEFNRDGFDVKVNGKTLDPDTQILIEVNENGDYDISVLTDSEELSHIGGTGGVYSQGAYVVFNGFTWRMISQDSTNKTVRLACNETVGVVSETTDQSYLDSNTYKWLNNDFASKLNYTNVIKETGNGLIDILTSTENTSNSLQGYKYYVIDSEGKIKDSSLNSTNSLIRPAINVYEGTIITDGTGTENDPYILREYKNDQTNSKLSESDISIGEYVSIDSEIYRIIEYGKNTIKVISTFSDGQSSYANSGEAFNLSNGAGAFLNDPSKLSTYMVMNNVFVGGFYCTSSTNCNYTNTSLKKSNAVYGVYKALPKVGEVITMPIDYTNYNFLLMTMYNSSTPYILNNNGLATGSTAQTVYTTYVSTKNPITSGNGTKSSPYVIGIPHFNRIIVPNATHKGIVYLNPTDLSMKCNAGNSGLTIEEPSLFNAPIPDSSGCLKFYIYDDEGDTYKMILNYNYVRRVGGTFAESAGHIAGWVGNPRTPTAAEIAHIVGADRDDTVKWNLSKTYTSNVTDLNTQKSWIYLDGSGNTYSGWQTAVANSENLSRYAWLFDYTFQCESAGCETSIPNYPNGYWTSDFDWPTCWTMSGSCLWAVMANGKLEGHAERDDLDVGIRPVIELPKEYIRN